MTATIHKISAGSGYEYLTRQVAALDATDKGRVRLSDYYSAKGESPGQWVGAGLGSLAVRNGADLVETSVISEGQIVTAEQMQALFGEGRHPNANELLDELWVEGGSVDDQLAAISIGRRWDDARPAPVFRQRLAEALVAHNLGNGKPWDASVPDADKATIRTTLGRAMFAEEYGRQALDDRELSGYIAQLNRAPKTGVAGYDLTFSPVKSVSTLWAVGHGLSRRVVVDGRTLNVSEAVEEAHRRAVDDALSFIETHACFGRLGAGGVQQVDSTGLVAAAFTHRDSRAGDPDLHTHVAVANKVCVSTPEGGSHWVALDGTPLYKAMVTASETYNARLEVHLRDLLGVSFTEVANDDKAKRPIREIDGVPTELMDRWSSRRHAIKEATAELSRQFQQAHGREPTTTEALDLAQQATLSTREAKHEPRSLQEQRDTWWTEATQTLGSDEALRDRLGATLARQRTELRPTALTEEEAARLAESVLSAVSANRATWQRPHLRAEAQRQLRQGHAHPVYVDGGDDPASMTAPRPALEWPGWVPADQWAAAVEAIVAAAEEQSLRHGATTEAEQGEPALLRRRDGASVYSTHDTELWTSRTIVTAERRIIAAAARTDGRVIDDIHIDLALLEQAANGRALNAGQAAMVRAMASSGHRVQVTLAPAGTGKTTAMRAFGNAWRDSGGSVIGLAPTAAAAAVLRDDLGTTTDTLAKLVQLVKDSNRYSTVAARAAERGAEGDRARTLLQSGQVRQPHLPDWFNTLDERSVLIVDEAGMAATTDLDVLITFAQSRGAAVRLVGDDAQLASISAGGVLRDIAHDTGALTLSQVVRFADSAEGAASLALRDGDHAALGFLADQHRIHVAADVVSADQAYRAWQADQSHGTDAVMLAATRDTTNALNARARADRLGSDGAQSEVALADGLAASVGDTVCTRRNNRQLRASATDWVRNGDRWRVTALGEDGSMTVSHIDRNRQVVLPADYVRDHVTLGYASTIHAAQGMTADHCHVVGSDSLSRQLLYVAMTRGRHSNHIYLSTAEDDPHKVVTMKALTPDTAVDVLAGILDRDDAQESATTAARRAHDPARRLRTAVRAYEDAVGVLAEYEVGADRLAAIERAARRLRPDLPAAEAWPVLRKHLAAIDLQGRDATIELTRAYESGEMGTARDIAAVLDWRLEPAQASARPGLGWLSAIPDGLSEPAQTHYLTRRAELIDELTAEVRERAATWTLNDCPPWAQPFLADDVDTTLLGDLAVFRAVFDISDADPRPTGPRQQAVATVRAQRRLDDLAASHVREAESDRRWHDLAESIDPHLLDDPYWPRLAQDLTAMDQAGLDVALIMRQQAATAPLPTELPASALWWRLSRHVDTATLATSESGLRPDWLNELVLLVGASATEVIVADRYWPGLVDAVTTAQAAHWEPGVVLASALTTLQASADDHSAPLKAAHMARGLTWQVELLAQGTPEWSTTKNDPSEAPLSVEEEEQYAPFAAEPAQTETVTLDESVPVDEEYLLAVTAEEPPEISEPEYAFDRWEELDFDELLIQRPATTAPVDVAAKVGDYYELRQRHAELGAEIDALSQAIAQGRSPGQLAAASHLSAARTAADAQRLPAAAVVDAETRLDEAKKALAAEQTAVDDLHAQLRAVDAAPERSADRLDPDYIEPEVLRLRLILELNLTTMTRDSAAAQVLAVEEELAAARERLASAVADSGGLRLTWDDVARLTADAAEPDYATLVDRRSTRDRIAGKLANVENILARGYRVDRLAGEAASSYQRYDYRGRTIPDMDSARRAATVAETEAFLVEDPVRLPTDAALHSTIASIRRRMSRMRTERTVTRGARPDNADRVRRDHRRVDAQLEAIRDARAKKHHLADADRVVADATADLAAYDQGRHAISADSRTELVARLARATRLRSDLAEAVKSATQAIGVPQSRWQTIIASAEPGARAERLAAAEEADAKIRARARTVETDLEDAQAKLQRALAEVERRDALTPEEAEYEELAREGLAETSAGSAETSRPATAALAAEETRTATREPEID